jgi:hypothetical protein
MTSFGFIATSHSSQTGIPGPAAALHPDGRSSASNGIDRYQKSAIFKECACRPDRGVWHIACNLLIQCFNHFRAKLISPQT